MQTPHKQGLEKHILALGFLAFGLIGITLRQSAFFHMIPGDIGDARFNNVILEHLFRWITGRDESLWSPRFFYPYLGALSFSDNHFGSGIVYVVQRLLGVSPEVAYIGWFTVAPTLNYLACYYTLRKLNLQKSGSAVGAFIFTFALPITIQVIHAQLIYRFAIPLAVLAWERLKQDANPRELAKLAIFVTWQFYCSIYLGYFLLLLLGASAVSDYVFHTRNKSTCPTPHTALLTVARSILSGRAMGTLLCIAICITLLVVMLYPYAHYSKLYGFHRDRLTLESMLPRLASYLLCDNSWTWKSVSAYFLNIPMRGEQQLFFGAGAWTLALVGAFRPRSSQSRRALLTLFFLILGTIDIHGQSIYLLIAKLPLANAIRAVSRIGLVMLFPLAILAGNGADWLCNRERKRPYINTAFCLSLIGLTLVEYCSFTPVGVSLTELNARISALQAKLPQPLAKDAILFVPIESSAGFFANEIDGMILAQRMDRPTLNGYSGNAPTINYYAPIPACELANSRLADYSLFSKLGTAQFNDLVSRVVIPGDVHSCSAMPQMLHQTHFRSALSADTIKVLSVNVDNLAMKNGTLSGTILLTNHGTSLLPSRSDDNRPVRFSWRFVDVDVQSPSLRDGWDTRLGLPYDVLPRQTDRIPLSIPPPRKLGNYRLEVSMVQEGVIWFHDAGMSIAKSSQLIHIKPDGGIEVEGNTSPENR